MTSTEVPYGRWKSPLSAKMVAQNGTGSGALPREIQIDGSDIYWVELRPEEGGRYVIVKRSKGGSTSVVTQVGFCARSRVHEYGGGVYCVRDGTVIFVNDDDQRLYRQDQDSPPIPITPRPDQPRSLRYADGTILGDPNWSLWVRERHTGTGEVHNEIVMVTTDGSEAPRIVASGHDFYSNPRVNPEGDTISWLSWDHPQMPWDGSELWIAPLDPSSGEISAGMKIAGGTTISVFQPEWSPAGDLYFVSDQSGWWNLFRRRKSGAVENLRPMNAEFGYPQWLFGFTTYTFLSAEKIFVSFKSNGEVNLGIMSADGSNFEMIDHPFTTLENPSVRADSGGSVWFFAGAPEHPPALCQFEQQTHSLQVKDDIFSVTMNPDTVSRPEQLEFTNQLGSQSYAYLYAPLNKNFAAPEEEAPPLIVMSHGGPTSAAKPHLQLEIQFWTSRGFAVLDVDYSGSVGYGRAYRQRLNHRMGVVDVDDCVRAAMSLVKSGAVNPKQLIVRGGSAGGYITLCALTFYDQFSAGGVYYGIADLEALAKHSHKFEAHYLDQLVGPYPEARNLYQERSPINHTDLLNCPMIIFQGLDDKVVLPEQSGMIAESLNEKGITYSYLTFENEGHGFNRTETIQTALEAELNFYCQVLGIA